MKYTTFLFDLDGVLVDTAKYHYLAWKRLADELGIPFDEARNEAFKGVSRLRCMELMNEWGGLGLSPEEQNDYANRKNAWYVESLADLDASELLPGTVDTLDKAEAAGVKCAICSASKNTPMIIKQLGITERFRTVIDGNRTAKAKPDPEVFLLAAKELGAANSECVIFEDSEAGALAGKNEGIFVVGIGLPENIPSANIHIPSLAALDFEALVEGRLG